MTAKEYKRQIEIVKIVRTYGKKVTTYFEFRYGHIKYDLFGEYYTKYEYVVWTLYKYNYKTKDFYKIIQPETNPDTPLTVLNTMKKFVNDIIPKLEG